MSWWKELNFLRHGEERRAKERAAKAEAEAPRKVVVAKPLPVAPKPAAEAVNPRAAIIAALQSIPEEEAVALRALAAKAAAALRAKGVETGLPVGPAPGTPRPLTAKRKALIVDAMQHWARGHAIFLRLDPRIRQQIRAVADRLAPR